MNRAPVKRRRRRFRFPVAHSIRHLFEPGPYWPLVRYNPEFAEWQKAHRALQIANLRAAVFGKKGPTVTGRLVEEKTPAPGLAQRAGADKWGNSLPGGAA